MQNPKTQLGELIQARYPVIVINSYEEERVMLAIREVIAKQRATDPVRDGEGKVTRPGKEGKELYSWSVSEGLVRVVGSDEINAPKPEETQKPNVALDWVKDWQSTGSKVGTVFVFKDFHHYVKPDAQGILSDPVPVRMLRDLVQIFQEGRNTLILVSPSFTVPEDMQKEIASINWPLPDEIELGKILNDSIEKLAAMGRKTKLNKNTREQIIQNLRGLSDFEASSTLSVASVRYQTLDERAIAAIIEEKQKIIGATGFLKFIPAKFSDKDIGGLRPFKSYAEEMRAAFTPEALAYGIDLPRGVILVGLPGGGKSLSIKALGGGVVPVLYLSLSGLKGGIVGQTEQNTLAALRIIDAFGRCIVWLDEVEKELGDALGGVIDGGTSSGQFGLLLTWLQEHESPAYVAATANRVMGLPPEFLRRFDDIFFVDLPSTEERKEIFEIHIRRSGRDPKKFDLERLARETEGFVGDEIRKLTQKALRKSFVGGGELDTARMLQLVAERQIVPISKTMSERITEMRRMVEEGRALRANSTDAKEDAPARRSSAKRQIELDEPVEADVAAS